MTNRLGHGAPLGAFRNLGRQVQRRSLGNAPLSVLDLSTFYPNGFPSVAVETGADATQSPASNSPSSTAPVPPTTVSSSIPSVQKKPSTESSNAGSSSQRKSSATSFEVESPIQRKLSATLSEAEPSAQHKSSAASSDINPSIQNPAKTLPSTSHVAVEPSLTTISSQPNQSVQRKSIADSPNSADAVQRKSPAAVSESGLAIQDKSEAPSNAASPSQQTLSVDSSASTSIQHRSDIQRQSENPLSETVLSAESKFVASAPSEFVQRQSANTPSTNGALQNTSRDAASPTSAKPSDVSASSAAPSQTSSSDVSASAVSVQPSSAISDSVTAIPPATPSVQRTSAVGSSDAISVQKTSLRATQLDADSAIQPNAIATPSVSEVSGERNAADISSASASSVQRESVAASSASEISVQRDVADVAAGAENSIQRNVAEVAPAEEAIQRKPVATPETTLPVQHKRTDTSAEVPVVPNWPDTNAGHNQTVSFVQHKLETTSPDPIDSIQRKSESALSETGLPSTESSIQRQLGTSSVELSADPEGSVQSTTASESPPVVQQKAVAASEASSSGQNKLKNLSLDIHPVQRKAENIAFEGVVSEKGVASDSTASVRKDAKTTTAAVTSQPLSNTHSASSRFSSDSTFDNSVSRANSVVSRKLESAVPKTSSSIQRTSEIAPSEITPSVTTAPEGASSIQRQPSYSSSETTPSVQPNSTAAASEITAAVSRKSIVSSEAAQGEITTSASAELVQRQADTRASHKAPSENSSADTYSVTDSALGGLSSLSVDRVQRQPDASSVSYQAGADAASDDSYSDDGSGAVSFVQHKLDNTVPRTTASIQRNDLSTLTDSSAEASIQWKSATAYESDLPIHQEPTPASLGPDSLVPVNSPTMDDSEPSLPVQRQAMHPRGCKTNAAPSDAVSVQQTDSVSKPVSSFGDNEISALAESIQRQPEASSSEAVSFAEQRLNIDSSGTDVVSAVQRTTEDAAPTAVSPGQYNNAIAAESKPTDPENIASVQRQPDSVASDQRQLKSVTSDFVSTDSISTDSSISADSVSTDSVTSDAISTAPISTDSAVQRKSETDLAELVSPDLAEVAFPTSISSDAVPSKSDSSIQRQISSKAVTVLPAGTSSLDSERSADSKDPASSSRSPIAEKASDIRSPSAPASHLADAVASANSVRNSLQRYFSPEHSEKLLPQEGKTVDVLTAENIQRASEQQPANQSMVTSNDAIDSDRPTSLNSSESSAAKEPLSSSFAEPSDTINSSLSPVQRSADEGSSSAPTPPLGLAVTNLTDSIRSLQGQSIQRQSIPSSDTLHSASADGSAAVQVQRFSEPESPLPATTTGMLESASTSDTSQPNLGSSSVSGSSVDKVSSAAITTAADAVQRKAADKGQTPQSQVPQFQALQSQAPQPPDETVNSASTLPSSSVNAPASSVDVSIQRSHTPPAAETPAVETQSEFTLAQQQSIEGEPAPSAVQRFISAGVPTATPSLSKMTPPALEVSSAVQAQEISGNTSSGQQPPILQRRSEPAALDQTNPVQKAADTPLTSDQLPRVQQLSEEKRLPAQTASVQRATEGNIHAHQASSQSSTGNDAVFEPSALGQQISENPTALEQTTLISQDAQHATASDHATLQRTSENNSASTHAASIQPLAEHSLTSETASNVQRTSEKTATSAQTPFSQQVTENNAIARPSPLIPSSAEENIAAESAPLVQRVLDNDTVPPISQPTALIQREPESNAAFAKPSSVPQETETVGGAAPPRRAQSAAANHPMSRQSPFNQSAAEGYNTAADPASLIQRRTEDSNAFHAMSPVQPGVEDVQPGVEDNGSFASSPIVQRGAENKPVSTHTDTIQQATNNVAPEQVSRIQRASERGAVSSQPSQIESATRQDAELGDLQTQSANIDNTNATQSPLVQRAIADSAASVQSLNPSIDPADEGGQSSSESAAIQRSDVAQAVPLASSLPHKMADSPIVPATTDAIQRAPDKKASGEDLLSTASPDVKPVASSDVEAIASESTLQRSATSSSGQNLVASSAGVTSADVEIPPTSTGADLSAADLSGAAATDSSDADITSSALGNSTVEPTSIQRSTADTSLPSAWSSLEDLVTSVTGNSASSSTSSSPETVQRSVKEASSKATSQSHSPLPVATVKPITAQPATQSTIMRCVDDSSPSNDGQDAADQDTDDAINEKQYSQHLELLAQEVYSLLRQRLSLEQERRGPKYPR